MAQEQQPAQDVLPVEKTAAAGAAPDAVDNFLKDLDDIRSTYDSSSLSDVLVAGSAAALQGLKALGLDKLFIEGAADAADPPKGKPAGKTLEGSNPAEGFSSPAEGFTDKKPQKDDAASSLAEQIAKKMAMAAGGGADFGGKIRDAVDYKGGKLEKQTERPLSRIEQMITKGLLQSARSGDLEGVKEMLATLNESPKSVDAVLNQVRESLSNSGSRANVGWERGTDDSGNSFVRMHLTTYDKRAGESTRVTLGSDGTENAYIKPFKGPAQSVDAKETLVGMVAPQKQPELRHFQEKEMSEAERAKLEAIKLEALKLEAIKRARGK